MGVEGARRRLPPLWLANLLAFVLLILLVLGWFLLQTRQAQQAFEHEAGRQAEQVAQVVGLHARGAVQAQAVTDGILAAFLGNTARFVDYLDGVEPFLDRELTAFAAESGLSVIRVVRPEGVSQGPPEWEPGGTLDCTRLQRLVPLPQSRTLVLGVPRPDTEGCVLVGMDSRRIDELREAVGLSRALASLAALPGVVRVAFDRTESSSTQGPVPKVVLRRLSGGRAVAETRTPVAGAWLSLDLDAGPLLKQEARLWRDLGGFLLLLTLTGGLGTWLLYRHQQAHDRQLRAYEQRLSRQREEAGLGRAAAAIAHEIRNPLNAMGMGLQRLEMEAGGLQAEHRQLIATVREALRRTDCTVRGLLDYARPYRPRRQPMMLGELLREQLSLYRGRVEAQAIRLDLSLGSEQPIEADTDLLRQLLDNLLRNALDATPSGGALQIGLSERPDGVELCMANDGFSLGKEDLQRVLEPWFTTKTEGTGLGLAIARRLAAAHGGELWVDSPRSGWFAVYVFLPNEERV